MEWFQRIWHIIGLNMCDKSAKCTYFRKRASDQTSCIICICFTEHGELSSKSKRKILNLRLLHGSATISFTSRYAYFHEPKARENTDYELMTPYFTMTSVINCLLNPFSLNSLFHLISRLFQ